MFGGNLVVLAVIICIPSSKMFDFLSHLVLIQVERGKSNGRDLLAEFEDALLREWPNYKSGYKLAESREKRLQGQVQHRISELEGCFLY